MNNQFGALLGAIIALLLSGCDQFSEHSRTKPSDVLKNYLDASVNGRNEEAYGYISAADKEVKTWRNIKRKK
jgi:hypothetical protein